MRRTPIAVLAAALVAAAPLALTTDATAAAPAPAELAKATITAADFEFLGAFRPAQYFQPLDGEWYELDNFAGLTHRYVDGQLKLYTISRWRYDTKGWVLEFEPPETLDQTYPFDELTTPYVNFGDIYQDKLLHSCADGHTGDGGVGLPDAASPTGLYWDEDSGRLYWSRVLYYELTGCISEVIGYSTLDDATHSGTGAGMWKVELGEEYRFTHTVFEFPEWFADAYLGGRDLALCCGGAIDGVDSGLSFGPTLAALDRPDPATDPLGGYLTRPGIQLMANHHNGVHAPRPEGFPVWDGYLNQDADSQTDWSWRDGTPYGIWIEGENRHGLLAFARLVGGTGKATILDDPRNSKTTIVVDNTDDILAGDRLYVDSTERDAQDHPFDSAWVGAVDGNVITLSEEMWNGLPRVGGLVRTGQWYALAGDGGWSRWETAWYTYDPADLAKAATGETPIDQVQPYSMERVNFAGQEYPLRWSQGEVWGATFDETTGRLYVMADGAYRNVYVYQFHDTPASDTGDVFQVLKQLLAKLMEMILRLIALFG